MLLRLRQRLTDDEWFVLQFEWDFWSRVEQKEPPDQWWTYWLILAGRSWGKTRTAAEWVRKQVAEGARFVAFVGRTARDVRQIMIEGRSGILAVTPPDERPDYSPSKCELVWPNGAIGYTYTGEEPDKLRGPEHDCAWADEFAAWKYAEEAWDNLTMGLRVPRVGAPPRCIITTTPRPTKILRKLVEESGQEGSGVRLTEGDTEENAENLPQAWMEQMRRRYKGTRKGDQELRGKLLGAAEGAYWNPALLDLGRITRTPRREGREIWILAQSGLWVRIVRVVVGIDPAISTNRKSDQTGIVVVGKGEDGHGYVLDDASTKKGPEFWGGEVVRVCILWGADCMVVETNRGGNAVLHTIRLAWGQGVVIPRLVPLNSQEDKESRIEPYVGLFGIPVLGSEPLRYENIQAHLVGNFPDLEDEMVNWVPNQGKPSPNGIDALGFGMAELFPMPSLTPDAEGGNVAPPVNHYQPETPRRSVWR